MDMKMERDKIPRGYYYNAPGRNATRVRQHAPNSREDTQLLVSIQFEFCRRLI